MRPLLSGLICPMNRAWKLSRTPLIASQAMGSLQRYGRFTIESGLSISCMLYRGVRIQLLFPVSSVSTKGYPNYRESGLSCKEYLYIYMYIYMYIYVYIYGLYTYVKTNTHIYIWLLIKIPLSRIGHSSRIKKLLSRNFRELHVYLSRGTCWPTTPLMKIRSPPAKLRQRITDHFLVAF